MINVFKDENYPIYLFFEDENIGTQFKKNILEYISNPNVELKYFKDDDPFIPIKIYGEILSKGWIKEAIPVVHKKNHGLPSYFQVFLSNLVFFETFVVLIKFNHFCIYYRCFH